MAIVYVSLSSGSCTVSCTSAISCQPILAIFACRFRAAAAVPTTRSRSSLVGTVSCCPFRNWTAVFSPQISVTVTVLSTPDSPGYMAVSPFTLAFLAFSSAIISAASTLSTISQTACFTSVRSFSRSCSAPALSSLGLK